MDAAVGQVVSIAAKPGRIARNTSMATRLALVVLFVTLGSILVTSLVAVDSGEDLGEGLSRSRLVATRSSRAAQVERYLGNVGEQVRLLGSSPMTVDALAEFSAAHAALDATSAPPIPPAAGSDGADLGAFYENEVIPQLEEMRGATVGIGEVFPANAAAAYLQQHYLADSPSPDDVSAVDDAGDGSGWSDVHRQYHPVFRQTIEDYGIDDLYLVDAQEQLVYTVAKQTDLGTDLGIGPLSGSNLANLVGQVLDGTEDAIVAVDLAPYAAAGDAPVGFIAAPVVDAGTTVGVIAVQLPTAALTDIVTGGGNWEAAGLGDDGEVYITARDQRLRTEARPFLEAPDLYLEDASAAGSIDETARRRIAASDTSVFFQRVSSVPIEASDVDDDEVHLTNYVGEDARAAIQPIDFAGLEWLVVSAVSTEQLHSSIDEFVTDMVVGVAVFVVLLTFVAVAWANRTVEPIRAISRRLRRAQGIDARGEVTVPDSAPSEFRVLAENFDDMVQRLADRRAQVERAHDERRQFLERFFPPAVARRVEEGDRQIIDQVPNATIVVLVVSGLADLVDGSGNHDLLDDTVDEADRLAQLHGLERVKLSANTYVAACGITRPYLDQAPRGLAFAREVTEMARDLGDDIGHDLAVAVGIDTGPVTFGLAGPRRLVYDIWGPTVAGAARLAQAAPQGCIVASAATLAQLPDDTPTTSLDDGTDAWQIDTPEPAATT